MTDGLHVLPEAGALADLPDDACRLGDDVWALTRPDAHLVLLKAGRLIGRLSVWADGPPVPGRPDAAPGCLGHAAWEDLEGGGRLIEAASGWLRDRGRTLALGPIDGSTWFPYRVVTESDGSPPFALEPWPSAAVARAFGRAGFDPVAHYISSRVDELPDRAVEAEERVALLGADGVRVRPFETAAGDEELRRIFPLLTSAFAGNPYYTPLDRDRFLALYGPLVSRIDTHLVLVAEREGRPVGVVLAFPDHAQASLGGGVDTVIVKTLAVDPAERGRGLGAALVEIVQERARAAGQRRAIHALMHAENASVRISRHLGVPFRRYALLGCDL